MQQKVACWWLCGSPSISWSPAEVPRPWAPWRRGHVVVLSSAQRRWRHLWDHREEPPLNAGVSG